MTNCFKYSTFKIHFTPQETHFLLYTRRIQSIPVIFSTNIILTIIFLKKKIAKILRISVYYLHGERFTDSSHEPAGLFTASGSSNCLSARDTTYQTVNQSLGNTIFGKAYTHANFGRRWAPKRKKSALKWPSDWRPRLAIGRRQRNNPHFFLFTIRSCQFPHSVRIRIDLNIFLFKYF